MRETHPLISIITVNYNQLEISCEMLDSVRQLSYPHLEVIFVDNASRNIPRQHIEQQYPEVHYIQSDRNLGFSGGNNLGIQASRGAYLFLVNNDTILADGLLENLLVTFQEVPNLGVVSPLICYFPGEETAGKEIIQYAGTTMVNPYTARNTTLGSGEEDRGQFQQAMPTPYAHGAAMLISREVIEKVGLMPEEFFLYYEELDWCEQIRRAGLEIYVQPQAKIYHRESVSVGPLSTLKTYYLTRNRIYFMRRNRSWWQNLIFTSFLLFFTIPKNLILYLIKGETAHLKAFVRAIWWNISRKDRCLPHDNKAVNTFISEPCS